MDFRCPDIQAHHNYAVICLNCGTPKTISFPFGTNGKLIILGVPILKHNTVYQFSFNLLTQTTQISTRSQNPATNIYREQPFFQVCFLAIG